MRGFSFLITWLVFGIPSSAIAVVCVAAKNADIRMSAMFEG